MNDRCPGKQRITLGGSQVVDLELERHNVGPQHAAAREGKRIVRGIADDSSMDEPMLLLQLVSNRNPEFSVPVRKVKQLGAQENAERLRRENPPSQTEHVGHRA